MEIITRQLCRTGGHEQGQASGSLSHKIECELFIVYYSLYIFAAFKIEVFHITQNSPL